MNAPLKQRLLDLFGQLNHGLIERESTLKAALLAVLAGENLLLVGPPGTAKSLIARRIADCIDYEEEAERYFEYLLTKFSTPEEIFGPLSISELKADRFKRNTTGYLPSVRIAFLDEIFKASSSILNALLTILNERIYHNGATAQKVPMQALIAASNELPIGQEELDALYDRFLVRSFVDYVSEDNLPRLLDKPGPALKITPLSMADLEAIRQAAEAVSIPAEIVSAIQQIWSGHKKIFKEDSRENLSDRRLKKAARLLCVSAATNGRQAVDLSDLVLLKDCLWNHPDNALKVCELVMNTLRAYSRPVQLSDAVQNAAEGTSAHKKKAGASEPSAKRGAVVKGYIGCGTEREPILIENLHDLAGLERPDVGQKGYWFRQTTNIDCSELTTWLKIDFQGYYDGSGHTIDYKGNGCVLFESVLEKSRLSNLSLNALVLARMVDDCEISACASTVQLLGSASHCTITHCTSGGELIGNAVKCAISYSRSGNALVANNAAQSTINHCRSGHVLIGGKASGCTIQDCQVQINKNLG